jgi:hypothetical protein
MADIWIPGYSKTSLGIHGGVYDETKHPKGCLHTTEGSTLAGAEVAYREYPPHIGYHPGLRQKHQYVPVNKHSYAFRGSESDDEFIIQVEIVGFAKETHKWPDRFYKNLAEDVIKPLEDLVGIPRRALRFYGEGDGIVLASASSPVRLSNAQLRAYSGWLGHQHIPSPDEHWDPGKLLIQKSFNHLGVDVTEEEIEKIAEKVALKVWGYNNRKVTKSASKDAYWFLRKLQTLEEKVNQLLK